MTQALYDAVKSGKVKLADLNDEGKKALKSYMDNRPNQAPTQQTIQKFGAPTANPANLPMVQQANTFANSQPKQSFAEKAQGLNAPDANGKLKTDYPGGWLNPINDLNRLSNSKVAKKTSELGQMFYTPGAGLANVAGLAGSAESAVAKLLPNLISKTGGKIAQKAISEAVTGAPLGVGQALAQGQDNGEALKGGLYGAALGGVTGGAFGALGEALNRFKLKVGPDYSNVKLSEGVGTNNPVKPLVNEMPIINGKPLNIDPITNQPIKLTPKEQAQQAKVDNFSRIDDNPVIPNTTDQIQTKTTKESTTVAQKANEGYIKTVDNVHRLDQFDEHVSKVLGGEIKPSDSTYKLALNSRGSDMVARQILEKNLVDSKGTVIHQTDTVGNVLKDAKGNPIELSLKSVTSSIPKGQETAFEDYLVAKHSITRMGRGEKVYADHMDMTIQKAQQIVDNYEKNPQFVEAAQKYYQYNQKLGQSWLVDTGILTQQQWDGYLANNPNYVPNNRIFSDLEKTPQFGSKKGFANQSNPVKRAEGSQRPIVSPIESTIENTAKYVKTAKQNEVAQTLYRNILKNPDEFSTWGEIVTDQPKMDVSAMLEKDGIEGVLNDIASGFEKKTDLTHGNIVSALVDGQRVHMRINDPQLLEAMTNLSPQGQHFIMDSIGKVTKTMKVLTTGLNPVFGLTRNIFRDIPMAFVASKTSNNPFVIGKDLLGSIINIATDGKLYNAYKNVGGGHSSSVAADRNLLAQTKEKLLPSGSIGQTLKRNLITKPFHALENLNNAVETAPRLGEFKRLQNGSYDSKVKGLYEANDVTVNFNKYGNYTKQADALFPYVNAAVQGLDKFVRIYKDNPKQAIAKSIGALTMPTIALYIMNRNNPDYQKLSKYTKDNYLVIPKGDGTFYKIAKPRETGIIFSSGVERALQAFAKHDPEAFKEFGTTFLTNFLPPGVNGLVKDGLPGVVGDTIAGPIQSLASNKDFLGRPIVSGELAKLSPELQFDNKTSEPAKKFGELINYSPKKIDFLIKSYGGIIGQLGIPATTQGSTIKDTLIKQITTDPNYSNDISADFYKAKDKADVAKADSKVTGEQLQKDLTPMFNKIGDVLSALRKQSNVIQKDSTMSREDKKKKQDDIQRQMNDIQINFLKLTK